MISLIKADLRRILNKRSFQIALVLSAAVMLAVTIISKVNFWNDLVFTTRMEKCFTAFIPVIFGIALFLGIYSDEFQAKSLQAAIGRGLSHRRLVLVKIIDCVILTILAYILFFLFALILGPICGAHLTSEEIKILVLSVLCAIFIISCCTPIAGLFLFVSGNSALSVFIELMLLVIIPGLLRLAGMNMLLHNFHIASYYIDGIAGEFYSDMILGGGGALRLLIGGVIYIGAAYLLTWLIFSKKEMDL